LQVPADFGEVMSDRDFRQQRISASYHPFAHTESGSMVEGAEGVAA